jgi:hypothetical protein
MMEKNVAPIDHCYPFVVSAPTGTLERNPVTYPDKGENWIKRRFLHHALNITRVLSLSNVNSE